MNNGGNSDKTEALWKEIDVPIRKGRLPLPFIDWYLEHTLETEITFSSATHAHFRYIPKDTVLPPSYQKRPVKKQSVKHKDADEALKELRQKLHRKVIVLPDKKIGEWD